MVKLQHISLLYLGKDTGQTHFAIRSNIERRYEDYDSQ